ncbi:MAG TPA: hypothetical protein VMS17_28695 [Gemmataceae bacterium]|nr:hypothetical protein [Gemmataceae bacterium]
MPQIVSCPDCGRKLSVPDHLLGRNVKCPGCRKTFLAGSDDGRFATGEVAYSEPARRDDDDRPRRRARYDDEDDYDEPERRDVEPSRSEIRDGWRHVRMGVNLVIVSMWVAIGVFATALVGGLFLLFMGALSFASIFGSFSPSTTPAQANAAVNQAATTGCAVVIGYITLGIVLVIGLLAYAALRITGLGFCMGVPVTRKTQGLKPLALATFCLGIAGVLLPTMFFGADFAFAQTSVTGCAMLTGRVISGLVGLAEFICFFLFLRGVALALRKETLAQNLLIYMIAVPILVAAMFGSAILVPLIFGAFAVSTVTSSPSPSAAAGAAANTIGAMFIGMIVCSGLFIIIGIGLFVWYLMLLYQVRAAIDERL